MPTNREVTRRHNKVDLEPVPRPVAVAPAQRRAILDLPFLDAPGWNPHRLYAQLRAAGTRGIGVDQIRWVIATRRR